MKLTDKEKEILNGGYGSGRKRAMQYLVDIGEALNAEKMVDIEQAHCESVEGVMAGAAAEFYMDWPETFLENVDSFAVPTTINSKCIDMTRAKDAGYTPEAVEVVKKTMLIAEKRMESRGGIPVYSCAPFGPMLPHFGQHIAITESGVSHYANSVLGARTHQHTVGSALAAAVIGKVPFWGRHLSENRYGQILVKFREDLKRDELDYSDIGTLAYWVGRMAEDRIPVWTDLEHMDHGELLYWSIGQCLSSGYEMEHAVGITPEAPTTEAALGPNKSVDTIVAGKKELEDAYAYLSNAKQNEIDLVVFGCPHLTVGQLAGIAKLLNGKKIHSGVKLICATSGYMRQVAESVGAVAMIEKAGGVVTQDACAGTCSYASIPQLVGFTTVVTNSATAAAYIPGISGGKIGVHYRNTEKCIEAAIKGRVN